MDHIHQGDPELPEHQQPPGPESLLEHRSSLRMTLQAPTIPERGERLALCTELSGRITLRTSPVRCSRKFTMRISRSYPCRVMRFDSPGIMVWSLHNRGGGFLTLLPLPH